MSWLPLNLQVWLIWPFLAWGCLIMVCYAVGYTLLGLVNEPICLFNIVNYMAANFKYNLFLTQVMIKHRVGKAGCLKVWGFRRTGAVKVQDGWACAMPA
jgi:hypothetical protein